VQHYKKLKITSWFSVLFDTFNQYNKDILFCCPACTLTAYFKTEKQQNTGTGAYGKDRKKLIRE